MDASDALDSSLVGLPCQHHCSGMGSDRYSGNFLRIRVRLANVALNESKRPKAPSESKSTEDGKAVKPNTKISKVLKCGICMEYYTSPVILSCGHTFCYSCLLDMGNYAEAHQINTSLRDLTIGCPNCRQPVFVMSVKAKRMTQNYPIASLVEGLRSRPCVTKETVDSSTNTDPRPDIYPEIPYQFDTGRAEQACRDYEQYVNANTSRGSVISDAKREIDAIRAQGVTDLRRIHVPDVNLELRPDRVHTPLKPAPTRSPGKRKKARASRELFNQDIVDCMFQPNSRNPAFSDVQPSFNRMS